MGVVVEVEGVSKRFGTVVALEDVSLTFEPGSIHAVMGENGAGKSTLMHVLGGFVTPDRGLVRVGSHTIAVGSARASADAGIAMVHQHFMLVQDFTVAENFALARASDGGFLLDVRQKAAPAIQQGKELGWVLDPDARIRDLPVGMQQRVEILKALDSNANVMIFDEPTAVLRQDEISELFRVLRGLREQGKTVILIAHKLSEVLAVADRISVLRKGKLEGMAERKDVDSDRILTWMLGERMRSAEERSQPGLGEPVLTVDKLVAEGDRGEVKVSGVDLEVRRGEILGIGGVEGNGQVELAETLVGVRKRSSGTVKRDGRVVYLPPDRHRNGLALEMSVLENMLVEGHRDRKLRWGPFLKLGEVRTWAEGLRRQFDVKADSLSSPAQSLSGGNQQKVAVARSLDAKPDVLVAVNPTRGLDMRAAAFVLGQIQHGAEEGAGVIVFSTDADELAAVSTRMLYMSQGKLFSSEASAAAAGSMN